MATTNCAEMAAACRKAGTALHDVAWLLQAASTGSPERQAEYVAMARQGLADAAEAIRQAAGIGAVPAGPPGQR